MPRVDKDVMGAGRLHSEEGLHGEDRAGGEDRLHGPLEGRPQEGGQRRQLRLLNLGRPRSVGHLRQVWGQATGETRDGEAARLVGEARLREGASIAGESRLQEAEPDEAVRLQGEARVQEAQFLVGGRLQGKVRPTLFFGLQAGQGASGDPPDPRPSECSPPVPPPDISDLPFSMPKLARRLAAPPPLLSKPQLGLPSSPRPSPPSAKYSKQPRPSSLVRTRFMAP